jgi:hypothetical protein
MRNRVVFLLTLTVQLPAAGILVAQQAPASDLTGTWILNRAKSTFASLPAPTVDSMVVTRAGNMYQFDAITDFGAQAKQEYIYKWPTGDGEVTNNVNGAIVHTAIKMMGDTIQQTSEITMQGQTVATQKGRVFHSADGKTLTRVVDVHPTSSMSGDPLHLEFVYDRR